MNFFPVEDNGMFILLLSHQAISSYGTAGVELLKFRSLISP